MDNPDKRQSDRQDFQIPVVIEMENRLIQCNSRNISAGGALLQVKPESRELINDALIGKDVVFDIDRNYSAKKFAGRIIRIFGAGNEILLAVRFDE